MMMMSKEVSAIVTRVPFPEPRGANVRIAARSLSPSAIGRHRLIRNPQIRRQPPRLPKHVDRDAAAWIPIAPDAQPPRLQQPINPLADRHRAILVDRALVAEAGEIDLQRL